MLNLTGCAKEKLDTQALDTEQAQTELSSKKMQKQPNILFISVDDLNDMPNFMGSYPDAITPNMDRLAHNGVLFTRAHAQVPLCGPSRASTMTSTLATTHGYHGHMSDQKVQDRGKEMGTSTMPEYFKDNGYHVMAVGKIFHKHVPKGSVHESGGRGTWNPHPNGKQKYNGGRTHTDWAKWPGKESEMGDYQAAEWAVDRLTKEYDKPFIMMVGFLRPHVPWIVPQRWFDLYPNSEKLTLPPYKADDLDDVSDLSKFLNISTEMPHTDTLIKKNQWSEVMQAYLASVSFVDHYVGKVIDAVESGPNADNTIIVLWSDHGYHLGEKNTFQKESLWERSSHVPLIFSGPNIKPKQVSGRVVSLIDILPTLAEMSGLPENKAWEGRSIQPLLNNPSMPWDHPAITTWQGNNVAVQTERYRYIHYIDGSEELYDHESDYDEWSNLASDTKYTAIKAQLKKHLPTKYVEKSQGKQQKILAEKAKR
ncbi:MAG: sulfatase [Thalassotalea sp.]